MRLKLDPEDFIYHRSRFTNRHLHFLSKTDQTTILNFMRSLFEMFLFVDLSSFLALLKIYRMICPFQVDPVIWAHFGHTP